MSKQFYIKQFNFKYSFNEKKKKKKKKKKKTTTTIQFQTIRFSINMQFKSKYSLRK